MALSSRTGLIGVIAAATANPAGSSSPPSSDTSSFRQEPQAGCNSSATPSSASGQGFAHSSIRSVKAVVAKCADSVNSFLDIPGASCSSVVDESVSSRVLDTDHHFRLTTVPQDVGQPACVKRAGYPGSMLVKILMLLTSSLGPMLNPGDWNCIAQSSINMSEDAYLLEQVLVTKGSSKNVLIFDRKHENFSESVNSFASGPIFFCS